MKNVKRLVIDAQGVVETSQSTCHAQFFAGYLYKVVPGASLAFFEDLVFSPQITFFNKNLAKTPNTIKKCKKSRIFECASDTPGGLI